jgi:hypothetical protein
MNFFQKTKIFAMLMAWISLVSSTSGCHCSTSGTCPHTPVKFHDAEFINKKMADIFVKIMSIFLGDPTLGKYFLYFFPDHLEGRGFHQSMPR